MMKPRHYAIIAAYSAFMMFIGWNANNAARYVSDVYYKARACDQIQCVQLVGIVDRIEKVKPPALRGGG